MHTSHPNSYLLTSNCIFLRCLSKQNNSQIDSNTENNIKLNNRQDINLTFLNVLPPYILLYAVSDDWLNFSARRSKRKQQNEEDWVRARRGRNAWRSPERLTKHHDPFPLPEKSSVFIEFSLISSWKIYRVEQWKGKTNYHFVNTIFLWPFQFYQK